MDLIEIEKKLKEISETLKKLVTEYNSHYHICSSGDTTTHRYDVKIIPKSHYRAERPHPLRWG